MNSFFTHNKWKFDYKPNYFVFETGNKNRHKYFKLFDQTQNINLEDFRYAGEIHRKVREKIRKILVSGTSYQRIANETENLVRLNHGQMAFPLGISVNEIMAHDSCLPNDHRILKNGDILKYDLGVHINGSIIDSAFTMIIGCSQECNHFYLPLLEATCDATYTAISLSGVDARLYEISESIFEVISSYELENGMSIKPVQNLGGHNILPYQVHGGKLILSVPNEIQKNTKMNLGEIYAIETFATTGTGNPINLDLSKCSHFMVNNVNSKNFKNIKNPIVEWSMRTNYGLPFTQRWIERSKRNIEWKKFINNDNQIVAYPPLSDIDGSMTSQLEHTIFIGDGHVEILSLGVDDY